MIEVRELAKSYGATVAVARVSFVARDGQVTGLLGPNGAGKSTTIRAMVGLITPDAGAVMVDGLEVRRNVARARVLLGVLPEVSGLYDRLTVREHVEYAGRLHSMAPPDLAWRVRAVLDQCGLSGLADRAAGTLSLGQRRRVALARVLVHEPGNVILDEPTNGLDVLSAREVRREIRRIADAGRAVVFSSHVMPEVAAVCDRVVIVARGRVVAEGTPQDLLATTGCSSLEDAFVALIGSEEGLN